MKKIHITIVSVGLFALCLAASAQTTQPVKIIFDTDIGPDCDDAGAMAVMNALADKGEAEIIAIGHCTSNEWGAPCVDAINHYYGRTDVPIGTWKKPGFLIKKRYYSYNKYIGQHYPNRFSNAPESVPNVVDVYRQVLSKADDHSIVFVAVGPLNNLAALLESKADAASPLSGRDLVRAKVSRTVIMGGQFLDHVTTQPKAEWNIVQDPAAAAKVARDWPTDIVFSGWEVGYDIITASRLVDDGPTTNPVRDCYRLHPDGRHGRRSWDLTAVHYAIRPDSPLWKIGPPGDVDVNTSGVTTWKPNPQGHRFVMHQNAPVKEIARKLDTLIFEPPKAAKP